MEDIVPVATDDDDEDDEVGGVWPTLLAVTVALTVYTEWLCLARLAAGGDVGDKGPGNADVAVAVTVDLVLRCGCCCLYTLLSEEYVPTARLPCPDWQMWLAN